MKDYNLPNDWKIIKLKDCIVKLSTGLNPRDNFKLGKGTIKYITAKNLTRFGTIDFTNCDYIDEDDKQIINKRSDIKIGDILFSSRAPIGQSHIIISNPDCFDIAESIFSIRAKKDIIQPEFLCLYFTSDMFIRFASGGITGSIIQELRVTNLLETKIIVPPFEVQKEIVQSIYSVDKKISNNNKIIAELESMAKTIYNYWFLQFDFPDEKGKPYKSSGGKMVYNEELKREIPKGWEVENVKRHCKITWGQCPDGVNILPIDTKEEAMLYCSGAGDMRNGLVVSCQAKTNSSKRFANENDILMSVAGSIGAICYCDKTISLGRAAVAFTPKKDEELFTLLTIRSFSERMKAVSTGSIQKVVNDNHLNDMNLVYDIKTLARFKKYNSLLKKMIILSKENQELASLRDFLLPMLMNGQVTFKS